MSPDETRNMGLARADSQEEATAELQLQRGASTAKNRDDAQPDRKEKEGDQGDEKKQEDREDEKKSGDDKGKDGDEGKKRSRWPLIILAIVAVLAIIGGVLYWWLTRDQESTDDAYTEGNAVSIAPKVSGYVVERHVDDNTFVKAGDLMIKIDPRDYITARDQARGNLDLARAQLASARIDLEISRVRYPADREQSQAQLEQARANQINAEREYRRQRSVDQRATTQSSVDQATSQFRSANASLSSTEAQLKVASLVPQNISASSSTVKQREAQVEQGEASLAQAELNLSYTEIKAPQDGIITRRNVDVGTYAQAGQQIFYLVPTETWVVANFKETQLGRMRVGQKVTIDIDAYPQLKLRGHIESIQHGAGARFTAFPAENATGNFVKIVRRVPVKILVDEGIDQRGGLPLGLSVEPTVMLK